MILEPAPINVLKVDPDLADGLAPEHLALAAAHARARVIKLEEPTWDPQTMPTTACLGWLGLLVIDGLIIRCVEIEQRAAAELFGPGDVIRPWDTDDESDPLLISVSWQVARPARLAILDARFAQRIAQWPAITDHIISRIARRARSLALSHAIIQLPGAHARLLILFWLLAERWGTVGLDGITIRLPLTHEVLATLVGVRRPTATIALQRLRRAELLMRPRRDRWLLTPTAIERLHQPGGLKLIDALSGLRTPA